MATKAYRDIDGNYICSDDVIFEEYIREEYTYNTWILSPEKYYEMILKENQKIAEQVFKEIH